MEEEKRRKKRKKEYIYDMLIGLCLGIFGNGVFYLLKEIELKNIPDYILADPKLQLALLYPIIFVLIFFYLREKEIKEKCFVDIPTNDVALDSTRKKELACEVREHLRSWVEDEVKPSFDGDSLLVKGKDDEVVLKIRFDKYSVKFQWYDKANYITKKVKEFLDTKKSENKRLFKKTTLNRLDDPEKVLGKID